MDIDKCNLHMSRGVTALADSLEAFLKLRNEAGGEAQCNPGLNEVIQYLKEAAMELPDEYWATMFAANHVGLPEVAARLQAVVTEGRTA